MPIPRRHFLSLLATEATLAQTSAVHAKAQNPQTLFFKDTGAFPNSPLPVLVYERVRGPASDLADALDTLFARHGWVGSWRNGLYSFHHYHSTAHEVLGVYAGQVRVRLGGAKGRLVTLRAGDVAVLPAGVAHKNEEQSRDFRVVGAYPRGTSYDMQYGKPGERPSADDNIRRVPLPPEDPVAGRDGALVRLWADSQG